MVELISAYGHKNVTSKHKTTLEITKDEEISLKGDCIIGVGADKAIIDLSKEFKSNARNPSNIIEVTLKINGLQEIITGKGHPDLTFDHMTDIVIRKSDFTCSRTLMIKADKSCKELNPQIIEKLKNPREKLLMQIKTITPL